MFGKEQQRTAWVAAALVLGTALLYWPVAAFDFTNFDDTHYILFNDHLRKGFTWPGLRWCFQAGYASNWHPLTWMSHMLDCQLFGLRPGPPHVVNVLLHAASAAVLFLALKRMTRTFWRSAMVAALFAWHPLHVESVAWVSERKDVLSGLFWMLTLWAYARYAEDLRTGSRQPPKRPGQDLRFYYGLALVFFALGLMAKPMVITLPCVLLLLDWWPLGRFAPDAPRPYARLFLEKLPFFVLAAGSGALTMIAQSRGGAVVPLASVSLGTRLCNASESYLSYVEKMFWPADLSVMYRAANETQAGAVALSAVFIIVVTAVAVALRRSRPYALAGWCWYLGVLVPAIGLVQVGLQAMADRYTYLPSIGIFVMVCWGACDLSRNWPGRAALLASAGGVVLAACGWAAREQIGCWKNSGTLFAHALAVDPDNWVAHSGYGTYLRDQGQLEAARKECQRAVELCPTSGREHALLGSVLSMEGKVEATIAEYREALRLQPNAPEVLNNLAWILASNPNPQLRNGAEAVDLAERACALTQTNQALKIGTLAAACAEAGRFDEALAWAQKAREVALAHGETNVAARNLALEKFYRAHQPYHENF